MPTRSSTDSTPNSRSGVLARHFVVALAVLIPISASAAEPRYQAWLLNGQKVAGPEVLDWHEPDKLPRFEGAALFDPANPVRWLVDNTLEAGETPTARVEFFGGDVIGGAVAGAAPRESAWWNQPPAVWFEPLVKLHWPDQPRNRNLVRLQTRWLKKVVWQARDDSRYYPGTAFLRDGGRLEYRALRWGEGSVRLLIDQEQRDIPLGDLAEIHLPRQEGWSAWWEQLATLAPAFDGTLSVWQMETTEGNRFTTTPARFRPLSRGGGNPDHWYHTVQPAWSLDPLYVPYRSIRARRFFRPHEVPLSVLEPTRINQRSALGQIGPPRVDRNVRGWAARFGEEWSGWGLGVHAHSEVSFELPKLAGTFRTGFALDRSVGPGGCARPVIRWDRVDGDSNTAQPPAFQAAPVVGTGPLTDTGPLAIPAKELASRLTLVVDAVVEGAPAGADPLEIRDLANWIQPLFDLEPISVEREIRSRQAATIPAWEGWTLRQADGGSSDWPFHIEPVWDTGDNRGWRFRTDVLPTAKIEKPDAIVSGVLVLSRQVAIPRTAKYLVLSAQRFEKETKPSRIQVAIDGVAVSEFDVPIRYGWQEAAPLLVPVENWAGKTVAIEIAQFADDPRGVVEWRTIQFSDRDPSILTLFEDDPGFASALNQGDGVALYDTSDKFSGKGSLKVTAGEKERGAFDRLRIPIRGTPRLGEYRVVAFAWKKSGGAMGLHFAREGEFSPEETRDARNSLRYTAGTGGRFAGSGQIRLMDAPPKEWTRLTRDVFGDFGEIDLSGVRLDSAEGGAAKFDHIVFARTNEDLARIDPKRAPPYNPLAGASEEAKKNVLAVSFEPDKFTAIVARVAPRFSTFVVGNGVWLLKEHAGRETVLKTHPPEQGKPMVFRSVLSIPAGRSLRLRVIATHEKEADWQLKVKVGTEFVHDQLINGDLTKGTGGWVDLSLDLSRFAGKTLPLEVHHHPNNWANEYAYWQRLAFE
jgi:hypothetical protein